MIGAVAEITAKEGQEAEFEKYALEMEQAVAGNEPGTILYKVFKVRETTNKYIFMEQYKDQAAADFHRGAEHTKRIGALMFAHMDGRAKITRMDQVK